MNLSKKSPSVGHKTIIDYDLVAIFVPLNIVGSLIGGILNVVFPNIFISVSLFLFLVFVAYKLFMKGIKTRKKESEMKKRKEAEASLMVTEASLAHQEELNKMEPEVRLNFQSELIDAAKTEFDEKNRASKFVSGKGKTTDE